MTRASSLIKIGSVVSESTCYSRANDKIVRWTKYYAT